MRKMKNPEFIAVKASWENKEDGYMLMQLRGNGQIAVEQWTKSLDFLKDIGKTCEIVSVDEYNAIKENAVSPEAKAVISNNKQTSEDKVKEITDKLEQGIKDLFESEKYKNYLKVMSRFHNYSFNNSLLIAMQKPDATYVAGYTSWEKNFDRHVQKGQKGIRILAPSPYKIKKDVNKVDPNTQQPVLGRDGNPLREQVEVTIPAYKVTTVFDVSQTEGRKLPEIVSDLQNDVEGYSRFMEALKVVSPVPIEARPIEGGSHGYYHLEDKMIVIKEGMSQQQTLKTCIHEIAHAILHDKDTGKEKDNLPDRRTKEVEAESVAYTICQHFGIDSSDYSFGYVAGWSSGKKLEELKTSMNTIRSTASEIINSVEMSLYKAKEQIMEKVNEQVKTTERTIMVKPEPASEMDEPKIKVHGRHH